MKTVLVCGAGGFIGHNLVKRLKNEGNHVVGIDLKFPDFEDSPADDFIIGDLRNKKVVNCVFTHGFEEVYQLAADMGGAGYVFTGNHDADIMLNSGSINLNIAEQLTKSKVGKLFFSSSACAYPAYNQTNSFFPNCAESTMYPAQPDSEYGWEKIFAERLYLSVARNYGVNIRIARFHNIFGPNGTYIGGKEKAPAAICRKVVEASDGDMIEIWGDGTQTRSFLYIDECLEGISRLMKSDCKEPLNIGSSEMVTINDLAEMIIDISGKKVDLYHIEGPLGVRGRNSDNTLIQKTLGWQPSQKLVDGLKITYKWIESQING